MMNENITTIMTRDVKTVGLNATLAEVKTIFDEMKIHHLPVVDDENNLLGIVTSYDLLNAQVKEASFAQAAVGDFMTKKVATLTEDSKVGTACELFILNKFHGLPIVEGSKLVGIVTAHDILKYTYKKEYPEDYQRIF
jgi:acetoin utilization protein AcuB